MTPDQKTVASARDIFVTLCGVESSLSMIVSLAVVATLTRSHVIAMVLIDAVENMESDDVV